MQRVLSDALISAGALTVLLIGLVAIDDRVRERIVSVVENGEVSSSVGAVTRTVSDVTGILLLAARDQGIDNAPMAVFVVAATALVLAMLRL